MALGIASIVGFRMNWAYFWWVILALFGINLAWRVSRLPAERRKRVATREVLILLLCYCGMMGMLMFLERRIIFVPTTSSEQWWEPTRLTHEDVWLNVAADGQQYRCHAWWCPNSHATATVLYCHGNAGNLSGRSELLETWHLLGVNVLIFDYPGYGRSEGEPTEASCQAAALAAYDWLTKEKAVRPEQLLLFGKSLGAAMAVELAVSHPCQALILYSPFTSVPDMAQKALPFFPSRYLVRTQFDNESKLRRYQGPLLIGHGVADKLVPVEHSDRLLAACPSAHKTLRKYADEDHGAPPPQFYADVADFLRELKLKSMPK